MANNNKKFSVVFRDARNGVGCLSVRIVNQEGLTTLANSKGIQICVVRELEA